MKGSYLKTVQTACILIWWIPEFVSVEVCKVKRKIQMYAKTGTPVRF